MQIGMASFTGLGGGGDKINAEIYVVFWKLSRCDLFINI
jgi:hypothetical protein